MKDWGLAQHRSEQQLARLHQFSVIKTQGEMEIEFVITVKEFYTPKDPAQPFLAQADKQTNQTVAPYTPTGWGQSLFEALSSCLREIDRFPYNG